MFGMLGLQGRQRAGRKIVGRVCFELLTMHLEFAPVLQPNTNPSWLIHI
jgi:hypothetical protein